MRRLFLIAAVSALAVAKPELYREKEDFQFSRSSSDDGSKSGFYGAQRGNMGGNYERAHNMDSLAQHQMSGLVRQVEGELGDASNTRTGSVFSAANSRGVYGSGNYDLGNLEGRNFQEGASFDHSKSHSSLTHGYGYSGQSSTSAQNNAAYSRSQSHNSRHSGYQASQDLGQSLQTDNLQAAETNGAGVYDSDGQVSQSSGIYSQSGYQGRSAYERSNTNLHSSNGYGSNVQSRLISATPVRVVVRPGTRVAIPVAAQTYDATKSASSYDQNAINSDTEILSNNGHQNSYTPSTNAKHYESSFNYHKEWEKHDTKPVSVPLAIPTVNPFLKNSELYDDTQLSHINGQYRATGVDSHVQSRKAYNANVQSASSSQSRQHSENFQQQSELSDSNSNAHSQRAYNSGATADLTNLVGDENGMPKSYQSSYSYHKAWERQGDPYVIKPASNGLYDGQASQRLTAASTNQGVQSSHQYGSHYKQSHQSYSHGAAVDCDCDENGHIRVARSYSADINDQYYPYQQSQNMYEGQEELGQSAYNSWENLEDLGQQTQSKWDNLENLGQQTQNKWDQLEDATQQNKNKWDKLESFGQQFQDKQADLKDKDLGQQTQDTWNNLEKSRQQPTENLVNLNQQMQKKWNNSENLEQVQNQWNKLEIQNSEKHALNDQFDNIHQSRSNMDDLKQTSLKENYNKHVSDHVQTTWNKEDTYGSHLTENNGQNINYQVQSQIEKEKTVNTESNLYDQNKDLGQQTQDSWINLEILNQDKNINKPIHSNEQVKPVWEQSDNTQQFSMGTDSNLEGTNEKQEHSSLGNNNAHLKPWNYVHDQAQRQNNDNTNKHTETAQHTQTGWQEQIPMNNNFHYNNGYHSLTIPRSTSSLQGLWDKIDNFQGSTTSVNNNEKYDLSINGDHYSHALDSQSSYQNGGHTYHSTSNSNFAQSSHQRNEFGSWQSSILSKSSTTDKPRDRQQSPLNNDLRPLDIGRGDIGVEDSSIHATHTAENSSEQIHHQTIATDNKQYKTPEEIEALSLTKETNKTTNDIINHNVHELNVDTNKRQEPNSVLNVLSLSQQRWLEEQRRHGNSNNNNLVSSTTPFGTTLRSLTKEQQEQNQFNGMDTEAVRNNFYYNKPNKPIVEDNPIKPVLDVDSPVIPTLKPNHKFDEKEKNMEQAQEEIEQQNMEQQFEDFGQQSQTAWGEHLEDLGQQVQGSWESSGNLQQANIQQVQDFGTSFTDHDQKQDFYDQKYQSSKYSEQQSKQEVDNLQSPLQKNTDEIISPTEPVTEKPGFWKSVGSKFTNAKDKVASWFQRS